ncbi:MAG: serine/threonine-protein kinase [Bradymonadales bacterium]
MQQSHFKEESALEQERDLVQWAQQERRVLDERYALLEELGSGAQGTSYRAFDIEVGRIVNIKVYQFDESATWKEFELFEREAETLRTIEVQGVPRYFDSKLDLELMPPRAYIVQEHIDGETLEYYIKKKLRFSMQHMLEMAKALFRILADLHAYAPPVIHRDIKPSNLILSPDGRLWLIDFGLVAASRANKTSSTTAGTYGYMPPEQVMGKAYPASDIYAAAMCLVHLFNWTPPLGTTGR